MSYAANGLTLWFNNMVPALFPFMVISGLAIRLDIAPNIISVIHPFLHKIFRTDYYCEYAIVMGFLCGYPMGAVIIRDLWKEHKITAMQANWLLSFCNNIGPVFFTSLVLPIFDKKYHVLLLCGMYLIPFLYGILMQYTLYKNGFHDTQIIQPVKLSDNKACFTTAFTDSLNQAVSSSLFLGACMIFFNMLRFLPSHFCTENKIAETIIAWFLEANGAVTATGILYHNGNIILSLFLITLLSLGGLSCLCQTAGILADTPCSIQKHIIHKIIQALLWSALTLLWLPIVH